MKFKTKQNIKKKTKSVFRTVLKAIIIILVIATVAGATAYVQKRIERKNEKRVLEEAGIVHQVKIDDEIFNISVVGNQSANHTFVTISDFGVQDFGVYAKQLTSDVQNSSKTVILDRLGSGYSGDTHKDMTIEEIVDDYRMVLSKKQIQGPYILLAHNVGCGYATYWESTYPDEIEGVIFIDPVELKENMQFDTEVKTKDYFYALLSTVGMDNVIYNKLYTSPSGELTGPVASMCTYMNKHSAYTFGRLSEKSLLNDNMKKAYESIKTNDIPKMYICASYTFELESEVKDYLTFTNKKLSELGQNIECDPSSKSFEQYWKNKASESSEHLNNETKSFMDKLGNCYLVKFPGNKAIYEQYTEDVKSAVTGFIRFLDGDAPTIYERYFDPTQERWERYAATIDWEAIKKAETNDVSLPDPE